MIDVTQIQDLLHALGYRLRDEAEGHRVYLHDDDAGLAHMTALGHQLKYAGWQLDDALRTFRHPATGQLIEVDPGGADTSGHWLHLFDRAPD